MRANTFILLAFATSLAACSGGSSSSPVISSVPVALSSGSGDAGEGETSGGGLGDGGYASISEFMQSNHGGAFGPGGAVFDPETGTITFEQDGETYVFDAGSAGNSGNEGSGGAPGLEGNPGLEGAPGLEGNPGLEGGSGSGGQGGNGKGGWIFFYTDNPNAPDHFVFDDAPGIPGNAGNALKKKP